MRFVNNLEAVNRVDRFEYPANIADLAPLLPATICLANDFYLVFSPFFIAYSITARDYYFYFQKQTRTTLKFEASVLWQNVSLQFANRGNY